MRKIKRYIPTRRSREMNIERVEKAWDEKFRINECNYLIILWRLSLNKLFHIFCFVMISSI